MQQKTIPTLNRQRVLRLANKAMELSDWIKVNAFAAQIYGENKAVKVRIETYEEYDDENYSYPIGSIIAYDINGDDIPPDYTLPFFQTEEWQRSDKKHECYYDYNFIEKLRDVSASAKRKDDWPWLLIDDLPDSNATYDLTTVPSLTLPTQEAVS